MQKARYSDSLQGEKAQQRTASLDDPTAGVETFTSTSTSRKMEANSCWTKNQNSHLHNHHWQFLFRIIMKCWESDLAGACVRF
jgi:hypothetical protein